jgi:hypothetical protein
MGTTAIGTLGPTATNTGYSVPLTVTAPSPVSSAKRSLLA